jgi:DNA-binding NarL/FixJ family response regulator
VLALIAAGLSNTDIARQLVLSNATVKTHVNHIFAKIGARDRAQAVRYAYDHGMT